MIGLKTVVLCIILVLVAGCEEVPSIELDQFLLDPDALSLVGVSSDTFNPRSAQLQFALSGAEFYQDIDDVSLTINGYPVPSSNLFIESHRIIGTSELFDGQNNISFSAVDTVGRPLYYRTTVWAGSEMLHVDIVDENGLPITGPVIVEARLGDDQSIMMQANTTDGAVEFGNLPDRTILINASTSDNRFGLIGVVGSQGFVKVRLVDFNAASPIDNNNFNQDTAGWDTGTAPIQITQHIEGFPQAQIENSSSEFSVLTTEPRKRVPSSEFNVAPQQLLASVDAIVDQDLTLSTSGEGEQSISRTFKTSQGTTAVIIRYRYITSEVPGGYFGTQFNDYFRVTLRSQQGGGLASESNSMNGLGLGAFDFASGATAWHEVTLQTNKEADTIQADVGVANVADDLLDSQAVVDFVREVKDEVQPSLAWNNNQGGLDLTYAVEGDKLQKDVTIEVYWANGPRYSNRIGAPIFSQVVPAGTAPGQYGPFQIAGNLLTNDPAGVTHIIATSSPTSVGSVVDVSVGFGANANAAVVSAGMMDIIKDGLRVAGQHAATITSTARTPADQARAMFYNLVRPPLTVAQNVNIQLNGDATCRTPGGFCGYGAAGDAVINEFVAQTQGMTLQQINQNRATIEAAMVLEINNQAALGNRVSNHIADPTQISVVDVNSTAFNANNGPLFVNEVQGRLTRFLDERLSNHCYHLELEI